MFDPSGPLSRSVYLRRRALAIGTSALAVVLLIWIIGGLVGTEDQPLVRAAAGPDARSSPPSTTPEPTASSSISAAPSTSETPPPPPPPPPPDPNLPCPDPAIQLAAEAGAPSYRVGTRPVLRLTVTNAGPVPCTRDISRSLRELTVLAADGARVWSSNDCYTPPRDPESRILAPGERLTFTVTWAGRTSAPGCPAKRTAVAAGAYQVVPKLGALAGAPLTVTITP